MTVSRDWCEEHNRGSLAETNGLCPECEERSVERAEQRNKYPAAPYPSDVELIEPGSILDVTQTDLDYAAGCLGWGGGVFSVSGLAVRLADYARKTREECAKVADRMAERAADSAQVVMANGAEEARRAQPGSVRVIVADVRDKQNYLHGKRHSAVEIAKGIRALTTGSSRG